MREKMAAVFGRIKKIPAFCSEKWNALSDRQKLIAKLIGSGLILLLGLILFLAYRSDFYTEQGEFQKKKMLFFVLSFLFYAGALHWKNPLKDVANTVINVLLAVGLPVVLFVVTQIFYGVSVDQLIKMTLIKVLLNLLILYLIEFVVYATTLNIRLSITFMSGFAVLFTVVNLYLIRFRQIPLLYSDLAVLGTAGNVAKSYDYRPDLTILICVMIFADIVVLSRKLQKHKDVLKKTWILRSVLTVIAVASVIRFGQVTIYTDFLKENGVSVNTFRPIKAYVRSGGMLTFLRSIGLSIVKKPQDYSPEKVGELAADYPSDESGADAKKPNVIVIMDEAFADLQSVGEFATSQEVMPFYKSLKKDTVKGFAYVSVFGGKTANTEFEFLTGDTNAFLPAGATPYQIFVKDYIPSLTASCRDQDYQGIIAMHPFLGNGYNRVNVYDHLGFNRFITVDDYPEDAPKVREFVSDDGDISRIISEYEEAKKNSDAPFYLFNVTMQNHSPYDKDYDNLPKDITIETDKVKNDAAARYLNLIHLSDEALKKLVTYFAEKKDPTVIVFFGDHEPGLSDSFYEKLLGKNLDAMTAEESMEMYRVPYMIWANYDIPEKENMTTSINYLRAQMLETAGMNMTGYDKYLLGLAKEIPAITANGYFGKDGRYYALTDKKSPYYTLVHEYEMIQYNHLFDASNRNAFFELKK